MYACQNNNIEVARELIKHTKNINAGDYKGHTVSFVIIINEINHHV